MTQFRPTRFEILPPVIKNLLIINGLVFLAQVTFRNSPYALEPIFALHTWQSELFQPWQFVTHMFMHGDFGHLFFNMFALWMFGSILENVWGQKRFLTFYLICGLGAALCHMITLYFEYQQIINEYNAINSQVELYNFMSRYATESMAVTPENGNMVLRRALNGETVGASGAVYGCLVAFGFLFPNTYIYLYFFLPLKAKWFVIGYIAIELFATFQNSAGDNVAHFAHLGGALFGFLMVLFWNKKNRRTFY